MKWERKDSDSVTLGSNVTMEHWADLSSPNPIARLPVLGPHAGKKSSTWANSGRLEGHQRRRWSGRHPNPILDRVDGADGAPLTRAGSWFSRAPE